MTSGPSHQPYGPPSCYSSALTCGVCLEEFRDPRALPCLHTFCLDCLLRLHQRGLGGGGSRLGCPCCRRLCQLPAVGPEGLPRNFHVARLREMRPLMQMGQGLAEEFADRATRELARLPSEAQLRADAADCRRRLADLRANQHGIAAFLDAVEEAVRDEREAMSEALAEAKAQVKAKRKRVKDCLARRSVSERLLDCAKSDRHQLVLDLIGEFRDKCASSNSSGFTSEPSSSSIVATPTEAQVRGRLRVRLLQLAGNAESSSTSSISPTPSPSPSASSHQCHRKRQRPRQRRQRRHQALQGARKRGANPNSPTKSSNKKRKRADSTESSSRLLDDSEIEELCREYGLTSYMLYEED